MFKILNNKEINRDEWDEFILDSNKQAVYALSWYLDIVSPEWKVAVLQEKGKILAAIPFNHQRKASFISFSNNPFFVQQLGIFTKPGTPERVADILLSQVIKKWKKNYVFFDHQFNSDNNEILKKTRLPSRTTLTPRLTHTLNLLQEWPDLKKGFNSNQKRNIKKALKSGLSASQEKDLAPVIKLFRKHKGLEIKEVKDEHYQLLHNLYIKAQTKISTELICIRDSENNLEAGALFLINSKYIVYLFGGATTKGKKLGAMPLIFNTLIEKYSGSGKTLDFEGSNIPSLARFYKGFGAKPETYYSIEYNKYNFLIKTLRKIKNVCFS